MNMFWLKSVVRKNRAGRMSIKLTILDNKICEGTKGRNFREHITLKSSRQVKYIETHPNKTP